MKNPQTIPELAAEICHIGRIVWEKNMVASNDGNISARLPDGNILCTPTNMSKGFLEESDLVLLDLEGNQIEGARKPSSEVKMHLQIYKDNPKVMGVVHAHPTFATCYAVAGKAPAIDLVAETAVLMPKIPVANFAVPSTKAVADSVRGLANDSEVCLLEHHGALAWATSLWGAYWNLERLEHVCKLSYFTSVGNLARPMSTEYVQEIHEVFPVAR